jgi:Uncharacterised protein family UPF0547
LAPSDPAFFPSEIGLVLSSVALVRLVVSGSAAFVDFLIWTGITAGVTAGAAATLFFIYVAVWPNKAVAWWKRVASGVFAVVTPIVVASLLAHGERELLIIFGVAALVPASILLSVIYSAHKENRVDSVKTCPDCIEEVNAAARVCRYCGYRFPERQEQEGQSRATLGATD